MWPGSRTSLVALVLFPVAISAVGVLLALVSRTGYELLTAEDRIGESIQFVCFGASGILAAVLAGRHFRAGHRALGVCFAVAALGLIFVTGEEISWGQRLLDLSPPPTLEQLNRQDELNVHNIPTIQRAFGWGLLVVGAYGTVAPLLVRWTSIRRRSPYLTDSVVPHVAFVPSFLILFVFRVYRNLLPAPDSYYFTIHRFAEVTELIFAVALVVFLTQRLRATST